MSPPPITPLSQLRRQREWEKRHDERARQGLTGSSPSGCQCFLPLQQHKRQSEHCGKEEMWRLGDRIWTGGAFFLVLSSSRSLWNPAVGRWLEAELLQKPPSTSPIDSPCSRSSSDIWVSHLARGCSGTPRFDWAALLWHLHWIQALSFIYDATFVSFRSLKNKTKQLNSKNLLKRI